MMTQSYGPEARGGACRSDVIMSDEPIDYPKVAHVDCLVALSLDAYLTFFRAVKPRGIVLFDKDLVDIPEWAKRADLSYYGVLVIEAAREIGNLLTANIVMLGVLQVVSGMFTLTSLEKSIADRFPKYKDLNLLAVKKGVELAAAVIGQ